MFVKQLRILKLYYICTTDLYACCETNDFMKKIIKKVKTK